MKRDGLDGLMGFDYAHRGLFDTANGIPENSLAAFENAVKHGYGIELDVQLTKDEVVVVCHDRNLKRLFGMEGDIKSLNYVDVAFLPTLEQALKTVGGKTPLIVELKSYNRIYLLAAKVRDILKGYRGAYCVESFDAKIVRWFRLNAPDTIRGQLVSKSAAVWRCFISKPDFIAAKIGMEKGCVIKWLKKRFALFTVAWTARTAGEMKTAKRSYNLQIFELSALKD
jgi:Glycerophosphoryl diester phosphodiesterase